METLWNDLGYGTRMLLKSPGFTFVAVLTLALGIGANTALFSVVNAVLLTPLPYPEPDRLLKIYQKTAQFDQGSVSYPNFLDWQKDNHTFQLMAAQRTDDFNLTGAGEAERLRGDMVSAQFFPLLGIRPLLGRTFSPEEDRLGGPPVALISADLWRRKFGSSSDILGKTISLNGAGWTVIGVLATTTHLEPNLDLYVPIGQWSEPHFRDRRMSFGMHVFAQLAGGANLARAREDMDRISRNLAASYPEADAGKGITLVPLEEDIVGNVRPFLFVLLAAVGFVLLIACANVANLLLARSTSRMHEFAIRAALGAGHVRVIRQLLTESVLLAMLGGGFGLLLSAWGTQAVLRLLPSGLPRGETVGLDGRVLLFTLAISLFAGFLFGLAPAFRTSQTHVQESLRENARGSSGARQRIQGVLVVSEMALALVLLFGAGLMIRSLASLWSVNPGFNPHNLMTFGFSVAPSLLSNPSESRAAIRELHDKIKAVPGVEAVSVAGGSLPMNSDSELPFWLEGQSRPLSDNEKNWTLLYLDEPEYLKAMGIPLQRGRFFTAHDDEHSALVAVVDEAFARKYYPNQDPVGKRVNLDMVGTAEIIGVVGHLKQWGLDAGSDRFVQAQIHVPVLQTPDKFMPMVARGMTVVLRTNSSPLALAPAIRQAVGQMNSEQVMYNVQTMDTIISWSLAVRRFSMILLALFASLALILASVGIYGVISYTVGQRTREIGIRIALGAGQKDVLHSILSQGAKMALLGVAIGVAASLVLGRLLSTMLYAVSASDPFTFLAVAALLMIVALAACYIPARRAMNVDPINTLRYE
ncbi:MAG: ABC transporter permease [Bryobacteraceae bacterium]